MYGLKPVPFKDCALLFSGVVVDRVRSYFCSPARDGDYSQWGLWRLITTLDGINERSGLNALFWSPGDRFHPANPKDPGHATG
jgi:hypothetical protein